MTPILAPKTFFIALLFIIAILYSFSGIFFGLDFTDSFYHLNQALRPANGVYLYPFFLSSVIIKEIIEMMGTEVIYIRLINWLLLFTSMLLPFFFFKVTQKRYLVLTYMVIALILYAPFNANILGYDTLSIFINSLLFTLTALYVKKRSIYIILFLALFGAMAIMIRLPNILAIPVISLFIIIAGRLGRNNMNIVNGRAGLFLGLTLLLIFCGFAIYYENWEQVITASLNTEISYLQIFSNYFWDGVKIVGFTIMILIGLIIHEYRKDFYNTNLIRGLLLACFLLINYFLVWGSKYSINYILFVIAFAISISIIQLFTRSGKKLTFERLIIYLFILFLFINPFGSNTGLLKAYSLTLLLPFVLSMNQIKNKEYWALLLAVLIPFSILTKFIGVYEDKNLLTLNEKVELESLSNIYTNRERKIFLLEIDRIVGQLNEQGVEVFFYGDKSHLFNYMYPQTSLSINTFLQPEKELFEIDEVIEAIKGKARVAIILINHYPEIEPPSETTIPQLIINYHGFREIKDGKVKYFLKI